jgi:hypothetical protein
METSGSFVSSIFSHTYGQNSSNLISEKKLVSALVALLRFGQGREDTAWREAPLVDKAKALAKCKE